MVNSTKHQSTRPPFQEGQKFKANSYSSGFADRLSILLVQIQRASEIQDVGTAIALRKNLISVTSIGRSSIQNWQEAIYGG